MYATDFFVLTRLTPIASNCRYAIVPVESCVNVWRFPSRESVHR